MLVSRFCLGTMNYGSITGEKEAFAIMDRALDAGINFFDTANTYGGEIKGRTEELIGRWFKQGGNRRERVILSTKVHGNMQDQSDGPNMPDGLSAYKIHRHFEASLRRLQTDYIELYFMHHVEPSVSWEELWGALEPLVNQGRVGYIGSSNFGGWHIMKAQAAAEKRGFLGIICEQHKYSLTCRLPELEVLPCCLDRGIGAVAWSPLDGGLLSGTLLNPAPGSRSAEKARTLSPERRTQLEAYAVFCREIGESEPNVALAWILANPAFSATTVGVRTLEQLESSLRALDIRLDDGMLQRLDEIFPGPGGAAPYAYAW